MEEFNLNDLYSKETIKIFEEASKAIRSHWLMRHDPRRRKDLDPNKYPMLSWVEEICRNRGRTFKNPYMVAYYGRALKNLTEAFKKSVENLDHAFLEALHKCYDEVAAKNIWSGIAGDLQAEIVEAYFTLYWDQPLSMPRPEPGPTTFELRVAIAYKRIEHKLRRPGTIKQVANEVLELEVSPAISTYCKKLDLPRDTEAGKRHGRPLKSRSLESSVRAVFMKYGLRSKGNH